MPTASVISPVTRYASALADPRSAPQMGTKRATRRSTQPGSRASTQRMKCTKWFAPREWARTATLAPLSAPSSSTSALTCVKKPSRASRRCAESRQSKPRSRSDVSS